MAKYLIEIDCDNAAFEDENLGWELSGILRRASVKLSNGELDFKLRDSNGNTVGSAYLEEDEPEDLVEGSSDDEDYVDDKYGL